MKPIFGWSYIFEPNNKVPPPESNPDTITHPSRPTNRAHRTLTTLIKTNTMPLHQTGRCLFVGKQNDADIIQWIFWSNCFEWLRVARQFASLSSRAAACRFLSTNISQGSVVKRLRCLVRNLLLSLPVKEFWKSVSIWQSYRQNRVASFSGHGVLAHTSTLQ